MILALCSDSSSPSFATDFEILDTFIGLTDLVHPLQEEAYYAQKGAQNAT